MSYDIKLDAFEGPMDLLLHLIAKNKIDIYDIPIAQLTQQYINFIEQSKEFNIEIATEFLLMATKLIQIKVNSILPKPKLIDVDDDPREELVQNLLRYQQVQHLSKILSHLLDEETKFVKRQPLKLTSNFLPIQNLSLERLLSAFQNANASSNQTTLPKVIVNSEVFHIKDKMSLILSKLKTSNMFTLNEVIDSNSCAEIVATFLAMLELIKRQQISAEQLIPFDEIIIKEFLTNE